MSTPPAYVGIGLVAVPLFIGAFYLQYKNRPRYYPGKRAAVILSGSGYLDGSETTETSAILVTLAELKMDAVVFAPEGTQADVLDHQTAKQLGYAPRSMIQESARLTRGGVKPLSELSAKNFDALFIPGGFGVAKSLSNWASAAAPSECVLNSDLSRTMREFNAEKKPIGLCCISPVLAAVVFPGAKITLGRDSPADKWPYGGTIAGVKTIGADHVPCNVNEVVIDAERKIVTTPAFMCNANKFEVFDGVRRMVKAVGELII